MPGTPSPRFLALQILNHYQAHKVNLSTIINEHVGSLPADSPNKGFVRDLVWGVIRHRRTLDWLIDAFARKRAGPVEMPVRNILRLGLFQVLLSERVPGYAAVNETVELTRAIRRPQAASFVNAVLREAGRRKNALPWPDEKKDPLEFIAVKYAHPGWLIERYLKRMGIEETLALCQANNTVPPLSIRVNTLKVTRELLKDTLEKEGIPSSLSRYSPDGLVLSAKPEIEKLESYRSGFFLIQDDASQLISRILSPVEGDTILDLCSGPGIKTTHIAQLIAGRGKVIAVDVSPSMAGKLKENRERLGVNGIEVMTGDARSVENICADRILIDAPCSGLGVIRRKPDIKWNRDEKDVTGHYPPLQKEILSHAARLLKNGGHIVYSTCTTEPEENEEVIEAFLKNNPGFEREKIMLEGDAQTLVGDEGYSFHSFPHRHGLDGFFAAKLRKIL